MDAPGAEQPLCGLGSFQLEVDGRPTGPRSAAGAWNAALTAHWSKGSARCAIGEVNALYERGSISREVRDERIFDILDDYPEMN